MHDSYYFVTFRLKEKPFSLDEVSLVKDHIISGGDKFYRLVAVQVMPDHIHLIICLGEGNGLQRIVRGVKGVTAKKINLIRGRRGSLWNDEYHDRIVRSPKELREKLNYMFYNPVKAGLCGDGWSYRGWHFRGL